MWRISASVDPQESTPKRAFRSRTGALPETRRIAPAFGAVPVVDGGALPVSAVARRGDGGCSGRGAVTAPASSPRTKERPPRRGVARGPSSFVGTVSGG